MIYKYSFELCKFGNINVSTDYKIHCLVFNVFGASRPRAFLYKKNQLVFYSEDSTLLEKAASCNHPDGKYFLSGTQSVFTWQEGQVRNCVSTMACTVRSSKQMGLEHDTWGKSKSSLTTELDYADWCRINGIKADWSTFSKEKYGVSFSGITQKKIAITRKVKGTLKEAPLVVSELAFEATITKELLLDGIGRHKAFGFGFVQII